MVTNKIKNWLQYYRASLIDASRGNKYAYLGDPIVRDNYNFNELLEGEVKVIWDDKNIYSFKFEEYISNESLLDDIYTANKEGFEFINIGKNVNDIESIKFNKIEIAPIFIQSSKEHTEFEGNDEIHYPYWIPAYIREDGKLFPPIQGESPTFLREYLSPNPKDSPTIAEMSRLDSELSNYEFNRNTWEQYWKDCEYYFTKITDKEYKDFQQVIIKFRICKYEDINTTKHLLALYNDLIYSNKYSKIGQNILQKLLDTAIPQKSSDNKEIDDILIPNHYGYMGEEFPLSKSQREAFAKSQYEEGSDIFAINGPPGTGKTTLLQSFIANSFVNTVLSDSTPPLIVGCSTNNQAITNILDSMKLENKTNDILQERWLPDVSSFGLYLTGTSKTQDELKDYQYTTSNQFNDGFAFKIDTSINIKEYEEYFINKFFEYIQEKNIKYDFSKETDIKTAGSFLKYLINNCKEEIDSYVNTAKLEYTVPDFLRKSHFNSELELEDGINHIHYSIQYNKQLILSLEKYKIQMEDKYKSFPFYIKYIPFSRFKKIKENAFKLILKEHLDLYAPNLKFHSYFETQSATDELLLNTQKKIKQLEERLVELEEVFNECKARHQNYTLKLEHWNKQYEKKWRNLVNKTKDEYLGLNAIEDIAVKLDISLRHKLFWLCVHYREAEFVREQFEKNLLEVKGERGKSTYKTKLERLAKITPLFISTFHTLPKYCSYYSYSEGNVFYNNLFDFMIIDEAGQVSPEVAVPSLVFTKKLLSVGDIFQIEPIWGVAESVDYKNAEKYKVIENEIDFKELKEKGYLASSGSVMKLTLHKSQFKYKANNGDFMDGVLLREHRRCLDPIINYSNKYVYQNSLILKGGKEHFKKHKYPAMGYLHINGVCEKHQTSNRNIVEALTIIQWLKDQRENIEKAYNKKLQEIVAIVTPYSAQKEYIKTLVKDNFSTEVSEAMTVGTVHALQGAERSIIIFSPTNSDSRKPLFMDYGNKTNMLNVAVTRAKHSFLVFGNMEIFKVGQYKPSSFLAELLYEDENNALDDEFIYSKNTIFKDTKDQVDHLTTLQAHRNALRKCFKIANSEIIITSPFISLNAVNDDNILEMIKEKTSQGVKVIVLTDENLDKVNGELKNNSKKGRELLEQSGARLIVYKGIHNKTIYVDDKLLIEGSFNWLSASRDEESEYARKETSLVLQGGNVPSKVERIKEMFNL